MSEHCCAPCRPMCGHIGEVEHAVEILPLAALLAALALALVLAAAIHLDGGRP